MHKILVLCAVYKTFMRWSFGTNNNIFGIISTQILSQVKSKQEMSWAETVEFIFGDQWGASIV